MTIAQSLIAFRFLLLLFFFFLLQSHTTITVYAENNNNYNLILFMKLSIAQSFNLFNFVNIPI